MAAPRMAVSASAATSSSLQTTEDSHHPGVTLSTIPHAPMALHCSAQTGCTPCIIPRHPLLHTGKTSQPWRITCDILCNLFPQRWRARLAGISQVMRLDRHQMTCKLQLSGRSCRGRRGSPEAVHALERMEWDAAALLQLLGGQLCIAGPQGVHRAKAGHALIQSEPGRERCSQAQAEQAQPCQAGPACCHGRRQVKPSSARAPAAAGSTLDITRLAPSAWCTSSPISRSAGPLMIVQGKTALCAVCPPC